MDEDVTKLTDEELNQRLQEPTVEETPNQDEAPAEPSQEEEVEEESTETQETQETEETEEQTEEEQDAEQPKEEQKPPSRREQLRIQQILAKRQEEPQQQKPSQNQLDYNTALDADPEVIKQLEADREAASKSSYTQGLEQSKSIQFHTRLEIDAPKVEAKYSFLDKSSKDFDPRRADAINSLYLNQVGYKPGNPQSGTPESISNPDVRYSDFVEAQMEFAEALMSERNARTVKNVTKQAAKTGIRPDGSSAKALNLNKAPQQMSDEELNTYLSRSGYGTNK